MKLCNGDIIRNVGSGKAFVVIDAARRIAIRSVCVSNPSEWVLVYENEGRHDGWATEVGEEPEGNP